MERTLSQSLRELKVDPEIARAYIRNTEPPRHSYVICFTARSGSGWLTDLLANTGSLGKPGELFAPKPAVGRARKLNANTPQLYFEAVRRQRQTANGAFGFKMNHTQWKMTDGIDLLDAMKDGSTIFTLRRRDIVAQGLSLYRMSRSGVAHVKDRTDAEARARLDAVPYDAAEIRLRMTYTVDHEERLFDLLRRRQVAFIPLVFEDISADPAGVLALFARLVLGRPENDPLPIVSRQQKLARLNDDLKARFLEEHGRFVARIEARRRAYLAGLPEPTPRELLSAPEITPARLAPRPVVGRLLKAGQGRLRSLARGVLVTVRPNR
jgi:LPS sulfotransferase NodH